MISTLKEQLADWTDIDIAQHMLSQCLGLMDPDVRFATDAKHVYWSNHPVGNALYETLMKLVELEVLDYAEEPDYRVRWNNNYRGTWEREK